jgi:hypothetical protein
MVRADYCGDGSSWTRDGIRIDLYDRLGIQVPDRSLGMLFEAAWGPQGAICVSRTRLQTLLSVPELLSRCRQKIKLAPDACTDEATENRHDALLRNESFADR